MDVTAASVTVTAILERGDHIKNLGGYLRALLERKREGQFSLGPVVQTLYRVRLKGRA
ncbi:replication initiation protein RepC [Methylobacterium sp. A54F]